MVFDLNGAATPVDLPGEGGIDDGIVLPDEMTKSGYMNANNWSMTWNVDIPGANLADQTTVTFVDTLGAGHQLCDPTGFTVTTVRGSTVVDVTSIGAIDGAPGDTTFGVTLTAPAGGFDAGVTYRVSYQTCTPDGRIDPAGTTYDNSAQVAGWGEAGNGVGEVTNHDWQGGVTKSGTVLGGADRNGKVAWTVTVAGDNLVGKDGFTLKEELDGPHAVCDDTISGIRVVEQYGPNPGSTPGLRTDVTDQLTSTTVNSEDDAFEVRFTIDEDSSLQFRASDWRYVISYTTCVTTDGLPSGGTALTNSASVDGTVATSTPQVPGRTDEKRGTINTSAVTVDGLEYSPQTTLTWTITVPGEKVAGFSGPLTVTDTLEDSLAVCAAGDPTGGTSARLGLVVQARDQIAGGGLATQTLTGVTSTIDGRTFTLTIPEPTLPQPGGGDAVTGWSREYQYVISYTTCTASGGMDAQGTTYTNEADVQGIQYTETVTQHNRAGGTGQGVTRGSVAVSKSLADTAGADLVPAGTTFTVHVREFAPGAAQPQDEYDLQVPLDGEPVAGPSARGTGWRIELSEPTLPSISGVVWGSPTFVPSDGVTVSEDGSVATAAIAPRTNIEVALVNTARLGSVSLTKVVDGAAASLVDPDQEFQVTAHIDTSALGENVPAQPDRELTVAANQPVTIEDLPIGSVVTFTEVRPVDDDVLTWSEGVFSPESITVTADHATSSAQVTLTNSVTRTVGGFSIAKTVTGEQADNPAVPDTVEVTATWTEEGGEPQSKVVELPTDGTRVDLGELLLIGTEVTLTETSLVDGSSIAWGAPVWSGDGVVIDGASAVVTVGRDPEALVSLENHAATSTAGISLVKRASQARRPARSTRPPSSRCR